MMSLFPVFGPSGGLFSQRGAMRRAGALALQVCSVPVFLWMMVSETVQAFPPAPYYTLYGVVRDQVGQTVTAEGAEVILLKGGVEVSIVSAFTMPRSDTHEFYRHSVR